MRQRILAVIVLSLTAVSSSIAAPISGQGTWETTLQGGLPLTPGGTDYQAYYDTDLDLTWVSDANLAASSGYTDSLYSQNRYGRMTWYDAQDWINQLTYIGLSDWQLPTQADMGHLHYAELGHVLYSSTHNWQQINEDSAPFINVGTMHYWSPSGAIFNFWEGTYNTGGSLDGNYFLAWAVHDGDPLAAVPLPAAAWLFGGALVALGVLKRRQVMGSRSS